MGGGKSLSVRQIARQQLVADMIIQYSHNVFCSYFSCKSTTFSGNLQENQRKFCRLRFIWYFSYVGSVKLVC